MHDGDLSGKSVMSHVKLMRLLHHAIDQSIHIRYLSDTRYEHSINLQLETQYNALRPSLIHELS